MFGGGRAGLIFDWGRLKTAGWNFCSTTRQENQSPNLVSGGVEKPYQLLPCQFLLHYPC